MFKRWSAPGGYREVLSVSLPLVVSMSSVTLMRFTDRLFLAHYELEAIAAVFPAWLASFLFACFFIGVGSYVSVFVAQYTGRGDHHRVGSALWQGIWFSLGAAIVLMACILLADPIFDTAGHPHKVRDMEKVYYSISLVACTFMLLHTTLSGFFSGRGLTRTVMLVNLVGAGVNIPLDYMMINGVAPFPEMGIAGAGWATVIGNLVMVIMYSCIIFTRQNRRRFHVLSAWRPERELFTRLMRYGLPGGAQFFLDMFALAFFMIMVGRLGTESMAASNIAISIDALTFLPCMGFSIGISIITGQAMGAGDPDRAVYATGSTIRMALAYMAVVSCVFLIFPEPLVGLFMPRDMAPDQFEPILNTSSYLLRFVAVYCFLDASALVFGGTLKGAGDTRYLMFTLMAASVGVMVVPMYFAVEYFHAGVVACWCVLLAYIATLALSFFLRFRRGTWREIDMIGTGAD